MLSAICYQWRTAHESLLIYRVPISDTRPPGIDTRDGDDSGDAF